MSRWWLNGFLSMLGLWTALAWSQTPGVPGCETSLAQEYRILVSEDLLPAAASPLPSWGAQLTALVTQVRILTTHFDAKRAQADHAERAWAEGREQIRQLQQTVAQLRSELDQARQKEAP